MGKLKYFGGQVTRTEALAPWPDFASDEIEAVVDVLKSGKVNYWTGSYVKQFEEAFAKYHGMKYGLALANGTVTLELALLGMGIGPGDEVITTCRTFIASSSSIVRSGAKPILADIDRDSQNITVETIFPHINKKTKAILLVHLAGWPCDMKSILDLAAKYKIPVIEDCAQAHGAKIDGQFVGSFGAMSSFSFCQDKIMTTGGEGGILLLNDQEMYERMWAFKDHGKNYDAVFRREHPPGFRWVHESFGTNWRMTEMQGVIGLRQLEKLSSWVEKRRALAKNILQGLSHLKALRIPVPPDNMSHSYYKFYAFLRSDSLKPDWTRDRIMAAVVDEGIPCFSGTCSEIYLEKAFVDAGLGPHERYPVAKELGETSLMFMVHPTLDDKYSEDLIRAVSKVMAAATR